MSLYTKYRPQSFSNLVGQDRIRETFLSEIKNNSLTHAYLFCGPRGTGKTSSARLIAKALNCTNKTEQGEPCDACELCVAIREGSLIDVLEIDAASNRGIDEIRDLKEKIGYAPTQAQNKVYIIDEVHMLTKEAFNALLKTLEEPPANVYFILCTTEIHKIPETIISRSQRFDFKRIEMKWLVERLKFIADAEGIEVEPDALEIIAHHVEGGMRDAIGLLEQLTIDKKLSVSHIKTHLSITGLVTTTKLVDALLAKNPLDALGIINEIHSEGYDMNSFIRELLEYCRDKMLKSVHAKDGTINTWLRTINELEKAREMQKTTIIPQLPLEIAVIKLCSDEVVAVAPPAAVAAPQRTAYPTAAPRPASAPAYPTARMTTPAPAANTAPTPLPAMPFISTIQATQDETATTQAIASEMVKLEGTITQHWERIIENVNPPSLRRSLMQCSLVERDDKLNLVFRAKFHMEKVNTPVVRGSIEKTIHNLFGRTLTTCCELVIAPLSGEERTPQKIAPEKKVEEAPTPTSAGASPAGSVADKAMEMFSDF